MESLPLSFDPKIFLFSLANFAILFFILKKFFFAPIHDILEKRKTKIKESLEETEKIKTEREKMAEEKSAMLLEANKQSKEIIKQAEYMKKEILDKGKDEADKIIKAGRESLDKEREEFKKDMSQSLIDLVSSATNQALSSFDKTENQKELVKNAVLKGLEEFSDK